jgi:hypothetical protein
MRCHYMSILLLLLVEILLLHETESLRSSTIGSSSAESSVL